MSLNKIFNQKIYFILSVIIMAELLSFIIFLSPDFKALIFIFLILTYFIICLIRLEYGLLILLAELFIGSKGYLFSLDLYDINLSIRIAFWVIVLSVWLAKTLIKILKEKKINLPLFKNRLSKYFLILFIFIAWGIINGFLNKNGFNDIFFDFNGWLFFALLLPLADVLKSKEAINSLVQVFFACLIWLVLKTFFLLFIFSHEIFFLVEQIYSWVRTTGVGEITQMQGGFYRIFFQSHIFILLGFLTAFLSFLSLVFNKTSSSNSVKKVLILYGFFIISLLSVNIITFSRSNWIGLAAGILLLLAVIKIKYNWKKMFASLGILALFFILSFFLIIATVKFPYPQPTGGFEASGLLAERVGRITGEAGVTSRWALLPILLDEIKTTPIMGKGFGSSVTYISSDPRILERTVEGEYTTYAFEWGWLDIWLKLSIFGLLAYLWLIYKIVKFNIKEKFFAEKTDFILLGFIIGLMVLVLVHFFSPYLNHPLGIGYLLILFIFAQSFKKESVKKI